MNKIINFHEVNDGSWFEMVVKILKYKYTMVSLNDLESYFHGAKKLENACHITIDDGDKSFYDTLYPILKKHNLPATIFVSPSICKSKSNFWFQEIRDYNEIKLKEIISETLKIDLSEYSVRPVLKSLEIDAIWKVIRIYQDRFNVDPLKPQNMSIDQLLEVDNCDLITIGAHTETHPILANENNAKSRQEIESSIKNLSHILSHKIKCFAYPNGSPSFDFGQREMDVLKANNCKLAFSTEAKNFSLIDNPFSIPRYGLSYGSPNFIKTKLFFGSFWEKMRSLKSDGEHKQRIKFKKLLSHYV